MMGVAAGAFSVPNYYCLLRIVVAVAAGPGAGAGRRLRR